ncbi:AIPR family protein [Aurantimicrobium minutum]|uniref:AIPR family protein n=1 Tax=Aurantimicrobium minutum TaxID=708131 RepID=UPI002474918D|nr:AIPR family protein [Aurantimicrobium minutum]MDH6536927.1 hypothetical protein [Aurantimicrobium minutum]
MSIDTYFAELQNIVRATSDVNNNYAISAFVDEYARRLSELDEIDNLTYGHYEGEGPRGKKLEVDGYDFGLEERQAVVAIADYNWGDEIEILSTTEARKLFSALEAFVDLSLNTGFSDELEPSTVGYSISKGLHERSKQLDKVQLYLLTNKKLSERIKEFETRKIGEVEVEFHLWDIERLHNVDSSAQGRESLEVDLTEWAKDGIPALKIADENEEVDTYLAVLPGELLANIYSRFGSRVLEANVRSFLSARGNVNKGIRGTIMQQPAMFLAYNNGITATAAGVEFQTLAGVTKLTKLTDLQIVNGGQTTASLFYVRRNDKKSLEDVSVQMKLIVVEDSRSSELVPLISRYANSQNKVSEADFFSNHPFHVRLEEKSKQILTPAKAGVAFQTRWFYERVRGQFQNEKAKLGVAESRKFDAMNPKNQVITKTDAAKYLSTWDMKPYIVSQGAQKVFLDFAKTIDAAWQKDPEQFDEYFYKSLVVKNLIFNSVRTKVMNSDWYSSGYLANIVTYTIAKFVLELQKQYPNEVFDFEKIWAFQAIPDELLQLLSELAETISLQLTSESRETTNVTEWAKNQKFWNQIQELNYELPQETEEYLVSKNAARETKKESRTKQKMDSGISAQMNVFNKSADYWKNALTFGLDQKVLLEADVLLLQKLSSPLPKDRVLEEWQAKKVLQAEDKLLKIGFVGN